jgi:hypothetical protein
VERRERVRVKLRAPCVVSDSAERHFETQTEDISRSGMQVRWNFSESGPPPSVGDRLSIQIELPRNPFFGQRCLDVRGTVVRVSQGSDGDFRVAIRSRSGQFRAVARKLMGIEPVNSLIH